MPPPTSSLKPSAAKANGTAAPSKSGTASPANGASTAEGEKRTTMSKPDKAAYDSEQDGLNKEIAAIKIKLVRIIPIPLLRPTERPLRLSQLIT